MQINVARGFTLIELLVAMAIIAIILGFTTGSYQDFQTNQELAQAGKALVTNLRFAQSQALAGVKTCGSGSETLLGWYVAVSQTSYTINNRCSNGTDGSPAKTINLGSGITISTNLIGSSIIFPSLNKEAGLLSGSTVSALSQDATFTLTEQGKSYTVRVRKTGDVE